MKIKIATSYSDGELYILEGTDRAVKVVFGYSTGNETGLHNRLGTFAIAILGTLVDGEFIETDDCLGWDPDSDEVDWDAYAAWSEKACRELLS